MYEGFALNPHVIKMPPHSKIHMDEADLVDYQKKIFDAKWYRGNFIEIIIYIENQINIIIERSFLPKNSKMKDIFRRNLLNSSDFKAKTDLLEEILKEKKMLKSAQLDELIKLLEFYRTERNKWAHGAITWTQKKENKKRVLVGTLHFINSKHEIVEQILTKKYYQEMYDNLEKLKAVLGKLMEKVGYIKKRFKNNISQQRIASYTRTLSEIHFYYSLFATPLFGLLIRRGELILFYYRGGLLDIASQKGVFSASLRKRFIYKWKTNTIFID